MNKLMIIIVGMLFIPTLSQSQTLEDESFKSDAISASEPFRKGVELCYGDTVGFSCQGKTGEIPPNVTISNGTIGSIVVSSATGVITITASNRIPITPAPTYILTPVVKIIDSSLRLEWFESGTCFPLGLC